jgi:large subunit ribosomal protein L24
MNKNKKSHVKIGDLVKVITGNQKGFLGTISSIVAKKSLVVVEGIVPRIKYTKNRQGGDPVKQEIPVFIHVSNVMLWDSNVRKAGKIGYKVVGLGTPKKVRYFRKSGALLEPNPLVNQ